MSSDKPKPQKWSSPLFVLVVAIPLLIGANVAGTLVARYLNARPKPQPAATAEPPAILGGLKVDPAGLTLGEVWETPAFVAKLTLTNTTSEDIVVEQFKTGCECSKVEPTTLSVPAGQRREVAVHIDLMHRMPHQDGVPRRELSLPLYPVVDGKGVTARPWTINGTICSRVSLAERVLQFGDVGVSGGRPVTRSVRCHLHQPGVRVEISLPPEVATVTVEPAPGEPGVVRLAVTPNPKSKVGPFRFDVPLTVVRADGEREPGPVLPVHGEMRSPFLVAPSPLLLGEHPVGSETEAEFAVTLPPGTDYSVKQVGADGPDITVRSKGEEPSVEGGKRITYLLRQRVVAAGDKTTGVDVVLGNARGEKETVRVHIVYCGIQSPRVNSK